MIMNESNRKHIAKEGRGRDKRRIDRRLYRAEIFLPVKLGWGDRGGVWAYARQTGGKTIAVCGGGGQRGLKIKRGIMSVRNSWYCSARHAIEPPHPSRGPP